MDRALWIREEREVAAEELDGLRAAKYIKRHPSDLKCPECGCRLAFRMRTAELHGSVTRVVKAHFRLWPGASHRENCSYIALPPTNAKPIKLRKTIKLSEALKRGINSGARFRLNLLSWHQDRMAKARSHSRELNLHAASPRVSAREPEIIPAVCETLPYISSADDLAALYSHIHTRQNPENLKSQITLETESGGISWSDFFYERERYPELLRGMRHLDRGWLPSPIALIVSVSTVGNIGKHKCPIVRCHAFSHNQQGLRYTPQLFGVKSLLDSFKANTRYIVFGKPRVTMNVRRSLGSESGTPQPPYCNIRIDIVSDRQFAKLL